MKLIRLNEGTLVKTRNGFVTFWLWLGIIANIISPLASIFTYQNSKNLGITGMELIIAGVDMEPAVETIGSYLTFMQVGAVVFAIGLIVGYKKLLDWQKAGFGVICVVAIISGIFNAFCMTHVEVAFNSIGLSLYTDQIIIMTLISSILSIVILWAILQIKKNSVSCWKQLK